MRWLCVVAGLLSACSSDGDRAPGDGGRRVAPEGVCTGAASAQVPCQGDPDPCGIDSGFPGDEFCLPPPDPSQGVQIHLGPDDYDDPEQVEAFLLAPGLEVDELGLADIPTTEDRYFDFVQIRARPGSHHLINRVFSKTDDGGFIEGPLCPGLLQSLYFPGAQSLSRDDPAHGVVAPENAGLGRLLPGDSTLCMNQHAYNFTGEPVLREVWINVYFMDPEDVLQEETRVVLNADVGEIPPGARRELRASAPIVGDGRILNLYGHRHRWTERFAVWHNDVLIYDSWDWFESRVFEFNSITDNPPIDAGGGRDGAFSGVLHVRDGDELSILCDVHNGSDHALVFANEAWGGEMCILFGATVGARVEAEGLSL